MYDRRTYEELGGFVESTLFNEDMIYAGHLVQAGYAIAYAADAKVVHSHNYGCLAQLHRNFDLGVSQAQHPEIFDAYPSEGEGIRMVKNRHLTSAKFISRGCSSLYSFKADSNMWATSSENDTKAFRTV